MKTGHSYYPPPTARTSKPLPPLPSSEKSEATPKTILNQFATGTRDRGLRLPKTTTVDTDVTESASPAVMKEIVQPRQHENVEERIIREFHTHDIYHHTLPIIETEILPPKHFIESSYGASLVEIPTNEVEKYTVKGRARYGQANTTPPTECKAPHDRKVRRISEDRQPRRAPILADRKAYTTMEGIPRTEYLWRHPTVFEDAFGRTEPVLIPAGLTPEWKRLLEREDMDKACCSKGQAANPQVEVRATASLRVTAHTEPNSHDTSQSMVSPAKPPIPVQVNPRSQRRSQARSGRTGGHNGKVRCGQHGLAKKDSRSNLKELVKKGSLNEGALLSGNDEKHRGSSEDIEGSAVGRLSHLDDPSSQLRRETEERARREFLTRGKMEIRKHRF